MDLFAVCFPFMILASMLAVVLGLAFGFAYYRTKKQNKKWSELADEFNLQFRPAGWFEQGQIYGEYQGHQVKIWRFVKGSGKNKSTWTGVRTDFNPPMELGLKIYREHMFSGFGKMLGFQDIQTGDAVFDDHFVIKGKDETGILRLLTSATRQAILKYDKICKGGVADDHVGWDARGIVTDLEKLGRVMDAQNELVREISRQHVQSASDVTEQAYVSEEASWKT